MANPLPQDPISERADCVAVIGLGYVGLPLAVEFCERGFTVVGIDVDPTKIDALHRGQSYIGDVSSDAIARHVCESRLLLPTADWGDVRQARAIILCVPTPLTKTKDPDMSYVIAAADRIARELRPHQLVILESTVYPGATEEVVASVLERGGLRAGVDFALAFSPERIDPGSRTHKVADIPKIVGGITPESTQEAAALYGRVFHHVIPMTAREAEMAKLLENTFRAVNIGLVNELAQVAHRMGINIWNVIEAAKTKPFGFMPFYPGPGLGGHCIPIDPTYLSWKAKAYHAETAFIDTADRVNSGMPDYVVERIGSLLNEHEKPLKGSKILLVGVAYKRDVADTRESPALDVLTLLTEKGCRVSYHDPHVPSLCHAGDTWTSVPLIAEVLRGVDCAVITTDHAACDWDLVVRHAPLVFDTRNATRGVQGKRSHVDLL
jgi:UDP-N-acetyl-D-glucosamine dehydrogenase